MKRRSGAASLLSSVLPHRATVIDRVVLITGAGSGIGAELARMLVDSGAKVALLDRDEGAVRGLAARLGPAAAAFAVDVTSGELTRDAIDAAAAHFGQLDAVVVNAGIAGPSEPISTIDARHFESVVQVNLIGAYHTAAAAITHLERSHGYILVVSSIAAVIPGPTIGAYAASKAGVEALYRSLRIELHDSGIDVGIAYFGLVDTDLARRMTADGLGAVLATFPKLISQPIAVSAAAAVLTQGIARQARRVCAPWWVPALLDLRPLVIAADRVVARHRGLAATIRRAELS